MGEMILLYLPPLRRYGVVVYWPKIFRVCTRVSRLIEYHIIYIFQINCRPFADTSARGMVSGATILRGGHHD